MSSEDAGSIEERSCPGSLASKRTASYASVSTGEGAGLACADRLSVAYRNLSMAIRLDQVKRFLSGQYSPKHVAHVGAGAWSSAFAFDHQGQRLVVRFGRHLEDFRKDEVASTRFGASLPIPPVLEIGEDRRLVD